MWKVFLKTHIFLQNLRPLKVFYSLSTKKFQESPKYTFYFLDVNAVLVTLATFIGIKESLSSSPQESEEDGDNETDTAFLAILNAAILFLLLILFLLCLGGIWNSRRKGCDMVFLLNHSMNLNLLREDEKRTNRQLSLREVLFELMVPGSFAVCFFGALIISLTPLLMDTSPAHVIFSSILPNSIWSTIFYCAYLGLVAFTHAFELIQMLMCMCAVLFSSSFMLQPSYQSRKKAISNSESKWTSLNFEKSRKIYNHAYIFITAYNSFGEVYFPLIMLTGFSVNVFMTFAAIQFHSFIPVIMLAAFLVFDLVAFILAYAIYKFCVLPLEEGEKFREHWNLRLFGKMSRRKFNACRVIAVELSQFFRCKRSTFLNIVNETVNQTVSLLLIDE